MQIELHFEDQGQDLLRIKIDPDTGEILDAEPFHSDLYADGRHFVPVENLCTLSSIAPGELLSFYFEGSDTLLQFRWPIREARIVKGDSQ